MNLRDELPLMKKNGATCSVALLLARLEPAVAEELRALIADESVASSQLADLAAIKQWDVKYEAFKRHRRKVCRCH